MENVMTIAGKILEQYECDFSYDGAKTAAKQYGGSCVHDSNDENGFWSHSPSLEYVFKDGSSVYITASGVEGYDKDNNRV